MITFESLEQMLLDTEQSGLTLWENILQSDFIECFHHRTGRWFVESGSLLIFRASRMFICSCSVFVEFLCHVKWGGQSSCSSTLPQCLRM